jgi:hypothetical protein
VIWSETCDTAIVIEESIVTALTLISTMQSFKYHDNCFLRLGVAANPEVTPSAS